MKKFIALLVGVNVAFFGTLSFASAAHEEADENNDGYISTAEGVPFYGSVQVSLTTDGDTSPDSALAVDRFPVANDDGELEYERTFEVSDDVMEAIENGEAALVQHGIDINGNGEYDGDKASSLNEDVPFEATVPAACGIVEDDGGDYMAELTELNMSGAMADAMIEVVDEDDNEVRVTFMSEGLAPNLPHAQHVHFGTDGVCPPNSPGVDQEMDDEMMENADQNNDTFISVAEGVPFYGSVVNSLTTRGDVSADSTLALDRFPSADENGELNYRRTFEVSDEVREAIEDGEIAVVQHGIDINGNGEYDGDKVSSLNEDVPFEATVPAACGIVQEDDDDYMATLTELNSSDVRADASIELDGNEVTIEIDSTGLSAGLPHAQHFHLGGENVCPPNTDGEMNMDDNDEVSDEELQERIDLLVERIAEFRADLEAYIATLR